MLCEGFHRCLGEGGRGLRRLRKRRGGHGWLLLERLQEAHGTGHRLHTIALLALVAVGFLACSGVRGAGGHEEKFRRGLE